MKRTLAALSLAVIALPGIADDRGSPYEQTQFDRGVPLATLPHGTATSGSTTAAPDRTDSVWANHWSFIAPAP